MRIWRQFGDVGLPRCSEQLKSSGPCRGLIWPWQDYVFGYEDGPYHHDCHHQHLDYMHAFTMKDDDEHEDTLYNECRYCGRVTPSEKEKK